MSLFLPHFNLQNYNTLAASAVANFFVSVDTEIELCNAVKWAQERNLSMLVLGGGSNIVMRDDFPGLALHIHLMGKQLIHEDELFFYVRAAAGENWHEFVEYCLAFNFWGLENLSLIPGSVGAAPIQNIGAYGVELQDVFAELTAIEVQSGLSVTFTKEACQFGYRDSVFKGALKDQYIITSVTFKLQKKMQLMLSYPALQNALLDYDQYTINCALVSEVICDIRRSKLPDPKVMPNVGSFFKNPIVSAAQLEYVQRVNPAVIFYPENDGKFKLAAAWLIEHAGWKGYSDGRVAVHAVQALVLTNPQRLKGDAILTLARQIEESVFGLFGVRLELEPRVYP